MLKLNSLDTNVFIYHSNNDETIGTGANKISRDELIASGRLCATEYLGKQLDPKGFVSRLAQFGGSYDVAARKHMEKKILFCAVNKYEIGELQEIIHEQDPNAFVTFFVGPLIHGGFEKRL